jgi:hypothetical protein
MHGHLTAGGALGGYAARFLKCAPEEVIMSALPWALPWQSLGPEVSRG